MARAVTAGELRLTVEIPFVWPMRRLQSKSYGWFLYSYRKLTPGKGQVTTLNFSLIFHRLRI